MKLEIRCALKRIGIFIATFALVFGSIIIFNHYDYKKWEKRSEITESNNDKEYALVQLGELSGQVEEIQEMYIDYMEANGIQSEEEFYSKELYYFKSKLEKIASYKPALPNKYLDDVNFVITTKQTGSICDELLSQIREKIHSIRYGEDNT